MSVTHPTPVEQSQADAIAAVYPQLDAAMQAVDDASSNVHWWNETFFVGPVLQQTVQQAHTWLDDAKHTGDTFQAYIKSGQAAADIAAGNTGRYEELKADWGRGVNDFQNDMKSLLVQLTEQTIIGRLAAALNALATALGDSLGKLVAAALNAIGNAATHAATSFLDELGFAGLLAIGGIAWLALSNHPVARGARGAAKVGAIL